MTKTFEDLIGNVPADRFKYIERNYSVEDVERLRGSVQIEHTLADRGARKLWDLLNNEDYVHALGAMTGNQAMQMVRAGLKAIYLSGWQVAADSNTASAMYPDQSLYPANAAPELARRINRTLQRADQIDFRKKFKVVSRAYRAGLHKILASVAGKPRAHEHIQHIMHMRFGLCQGHTQMIRQSPCQVGMATIVIIDTFQQLTRVGIATRPNHVMDGPTKFINPIPAKRIRRNCRHGT